MSAEDYLFRKAEDGTFVRKLFGQETMLALAAEDMDGAYHLTTSASLIMPRGYQKERIMEKARQSWIALRYQAPSLACRGFRFPDGKKDPALRYSVPLSRDDVEAWVSATTFFSDEVKPFRQWHNDLKDNLFWRPSAEEYCATLHASALENEDEWQFSISIAHPTSDARSSFQLMEIFLDYMRDYLKTDGDATEIFAWGNEVSRLTPPGPFVPSIVATGKPPDIHVAPPAGFGEGPEPAVWMYPMPPTGSTGDASYLLNFDFEAASKIHKVTKAHGRTITQSLSALVVLAYAEGAIRTSMQEGDERFNEVISAFEEAEYHKILINPASHRHNLPGGYDSIRSATSSPLFAVDVGTLLIPLEGVKKLLKVDKEKKEVTRAENVDAFWDLLVPGVADAWKASNATFEYYPPHGIFYQFLVDNNYFVPTEFCRGPYTIVSSAGNLDRLNILSSYLPSNASPEGDGMIVTDVIFGIRNRGLGLSCFAYQYNGTLTCHFGSALEKTSQEMFDTTMGAFEDWIKVFF